MTRTPEQIVSAEVHYCVSYLVSTLAQSMAAVEIGTEKAPDLEEMCSQAFELASPIDDWEEAALQEGLEEYTDEFNVNCWRNTRLDETMAGTAEAACAWWDIEPYQREVFEHWIVSNWLAEQLAERGEKVDTDFAGMTVWARTTTGQGIASDSVIEQIAADMAKRYGGSL